MDDADAPAQYGVFGHPIGHSLSPAIHTAAFRALGINAEYAAYDFERFENALQCFHDHRMRGASVTIPHKKTALQLVGPSRNDSLAITLGCINTLVWESQADGSETLVGYNTDGDGALRALEEAGTNIAGSRMLIVGTGGAAQGIALSLALLRHPPSVIRIGGRAADKRRTLAEHVYAINNDIDVAGISLEQAARDAREFDIIIQCTSVGMSPHVDDTPLPNAAFREGHIVMDIVYTPRRTRLLQEAEAAGATVIEGHNMFLYQAVRQQELWTGLHPLPPVAVDTMRRVLEESLA